jgi:sulfite reductase (NADPH) flavoprotein alpha-component
VLKKVLFQLHWFFGITAGLVLAIMGTTGALYSYQEEILDTLNAHRLAVQPREQQMPLTELVQQLEGQTGAVVSTLQIEVGGNRAARVSTRTASDPSQATLHNFDPYTGDLKPDAVGQDFFRFVLDIHRYLAAGAYGKQVTAACAMILVFFCLSGLYLRWPRQVWNWRVWLVPDWKKVGRSFNWSVHSVIATWCLAIYLSQAVTGLNFSYAWFNQGLTWLIGDPPQAMEPPRKAPALKPAVDAASASAPTPRVPATVDYGAIWESIKRTVGPELKAYNLRLPSTVGTPVLVFYLLKDSPHPRALNQLVLDPQSGEVLAASRYADKGLGSQLLISNYSVHTGSYFGWMGRVIITVAGLLMPLFFITGWLLYLDRRRKKRDVRAVRGEVSEAGDDRDNQSPAWLIGFASQSGHAEQLAWQTAAHLESAGLTVQVKRLAKMTEQDLVRTRKALFLVSTFGDGEAPDSARAFERRFLRRQVTLQQLDYAVLGLGDRQYLNFCGFGRRLNGWLAAGGANALFPMIEVDKGDPVALRSWQQQLEALTCTTALTFWDMPEDERWTLSRRECLNLGSVGSKVFLLDLTSTTGTRWEAGDLVEIHPRNSQSAVSDFLSVVGIDPGTQVTVGEKVTPLSDALMGYGLPSSPTPVASLGGQSLIDSLLPLTVREYSIASVPEDGCLQLMVRQTLHPDGSLGLCSGWLTEQVAMGGEVRLRVRRNRHFHQPSQPLPVIFIGNGTGLAGLRALLKARIAKGELRNWLLYGERNEQHDFHCSAELKHWLARGDIARMDLAFSRDQAETIYVQDRLRHASDELHRWLSKGAAIYVCGSLAGMAKGVDDTLKALLGEHCLQTLTEQGRYCRDVY